MDETHPDWANYQRGVSGERKVARDFSRVTNPQLQESVFRSVFLPMFVGGGEFMNRDAWRAVAGSMLNEVDIFSGHEYLFTVPPVDLEVTSAVSARGPDGSMGNTLTGALLNAAEEASGYEAQMLVNSQIAQAPSMVVDKREEYMARWDAIFKRYGIDYKEVRREVAIAKYGAAAVVGVKDDIVDSSSKKIDEGIEFDDSDDDDIQSY